MKCRFVDASIFTLHKLTVSQNSMGKASFTMDMWSYPNKTPFMAIMAHWIEATIQETPQGPQHILKL